MTFRNFRKQLKKLSGNLVFQNLILVSGITLLIKGLGFYKETVVASNFGLSELLDTFYIAILVPTFISNVFLGAYRSVFIPNYIAELKIKGNKASFQASSFLITLLVSIFFVIIAYLFTDVYLENLFPNHTQAYYSLVKEQFYVLLPCVFFWGLASLINGLLNVANEYRLSTIGGVITPLAMLVCLFWFKDELGSQVLAVGTLAGSVFGFLYLLIVAINKKILFLNFPDFGNKNIKTLFLQLPAKISSGVLTAMNSVVDQFFAGQLVVGSIAAINYGIKIPMFMASIIMIAVSNVMLPHFAKTILENRKKAYRTLFTSLKVVIVGGSIVSIVGIIVSHDLVALLFERNEFSSKDTEIVSYIQQIFLIYVPFNIAGMIMGNFLTSTNKNAVMAYLAFAGVVLNILLDYIFIQYYGILGIAICTTVVIVLKNTALGYYIYLLKGKEPQD